MQHYIDVCAERSIICVYEILHMFELLETPIDPPKQQRSSQQQHHHHLPNSSASPPPPPLGKSIHPNVLLDGDVFVPLDSVRGVPMVSLELAPAISPFAILEQEPLQPLWNNTATTTTTPPSSHHDGSGSGSNNASGGGGGSALHPTEKALRQSARLVLNVADMDCLTEALRRLNDSITSRDIPHRVLGRIVVSGAEGEILHPSYFAPLLTEWRRHIAVVDHAFQERARMFDPQNDTAEADGMTTTATSSSSHSLVPIGYASAVSNPSVLLGHTAAMIGLRWCGVTEGMLSLLRAHYGTPLLPVTTRASSGDHAAPSSGEGEAVMMVNPAQCYLMPFLALDLSANAFGRPNSQCTRLERHALLKSVQEMWGSGRLRHLSLAYCELNLVDTFGTDTAVFLIDALSHLESLSVRGNPAFFGSNSGDGAGTWLSMLADYFSVKKETDSSHDAAAEPSYGGSATMLHSSSKSIQNIYRLMHPQSGQSLLNSAAHSVIQLVRLDISRLGLGDDAAVALVQLLAYCRNLRVLLARRNHFSAIGLSTIAEFLVSPQCTLVELFVGGQTAPPLSAKTSSSNLLRSQSSLLSTTGGVGIGAADDAPQSASGAAAMPSLYARRAQAMREHHQASPLPSERGASQLPPPAPTSTSAAPVYDTTAATTTLLLALGGNSTIRVCDMTSLDLDDTQHAVSALTDLLLHSKTLQTLYLTPPSALRPPLYTTAPTGGATIPRDRSVSPSRKLLFSPRGGGGAAGAVTNNALDEPNKLPPMKFRSASSQALDQLRSGSVPSSIGSGNTTTAVGGGLGGRKASAGTLLKTGQIPFEEFLQYINTQRTHHGLHAIQVPTLRDAMEELDEYVGQLDRLMLRPLPPKRKPLSTSSKSSLHRAASPRTAPTGTAAPGSRCTSPSVSQGPSSRRPSPVAQHLPPMSGGPTAKPASSSAPLIPPMLPPTTTTTVRSQQQQQQDDDHHPSAVAQWVVQHNEEHLSERLTVLTDRLRLVAQQGDRYFEATGQLYVHSCAERAEAFHAASIKLSQQFALGVVQSLEEQRARLRGQERLLYMEVQRVVAERAGLDESVALRSLRSRLDAAEKENQALKQQLQQQQQRHEPSKTAVHSSSSSLGAVAHHVSPRLAVDGSHTEEMPSPIHKEENGAEEDVLADPRHHQHQQRGGDLFHLEPSMDLLRNECGGEDEETPQPLEVAPEPSVLHATSSTTQLSPTQGADEAKIPASKSEVDDDNLNSQQQYPPTSGRRAMLVHVLSRTSFDEVVQQHPRFATAMSILSNEERRSVQQVWDAGCAAVRQHDHNAAVAGHHGERGDSAAAAMAAVRSDRLALASMIARCDEQALFDGVSAAPSVTPQGGSRASSSSQQQLQPAPPTSYLDEFSEHNHMSEPSADGASLFQHKAPPTKETNARRAVPDSSSLYHPSGNSSSGAPNTATSSAPATTAGSSSIMAAPPRIDSQFLRKKSEMVRKCEEDLHRAEEQHRKLLDTIHHKAQEELELQQQQQTTASGHHPHHSQHGDHRVSPRRASASPPQAASRHHPHPYHKPHDPHSPSLSAHHHRRTRSVDLPTESVQFECEDATMASSSRSSSSGGSIESEFQFQEDEATLNFQVLSADEMTEQGEAMSPKRGDKHVAFQDAESAPSPAPTVPATAASAASATPSRTAPHQDPSKPRSALQKRPPSPTVAPTGNGAAQPQLLQRRPSGSSFNKTPQKTRGTTPPAAPRPSAPAAARDRSPATATATRAVTAGTPQSSSSATAAKTRAPEPKATSAVDEPTQETLPPPAEEAPVVNAEEEVSLPPEQSQEQKTIAATPRVAAAPPATVTPSSTPATSLNNKNTKEAAAAPAVRPSLADIMRSATSALKIDDDEDDDDDSEKNNDNAATNVPPPPPPPPPVTPPVSTSPAVSPRPKPPNQFTEGTILASPLGQLTAKPPRGVNDSTMQRHREFVTSKIMPMEFPQLLILYPKLAEAMQKSGTVEDAKSLESSWGLRYRSGQQKRFAELRDLMVNCALHKLFDL